MYVKISVVSKVKEAREYVQYISSSEIFYGRKVSTFFVNLVQTKTISISHNIWLQIIVIIRSVVWCEQTQFLDILCYICIHTSILQYEIISYFTNRKMAYISVEQGKILLYAYVWSEHAYC